jgi:hypothetical protein
MRIFLDGTKHLVKATARKHALEGGTMARAKDNAREERIVMEAIVDAYGCEERAMGWYYYLDNKLKFPFKARCRSVRPISMLKAGEQVEVVGMAPEDECESEMFVWIVRDAGRIAVPLAQLRPLSKDRDTQEAVGDWLYWVDRGYEM